MSKVKQIILMLLCILFGAITHARCEVGLLDKRDGGVTIGVIEASTCSSPSKANSIIATLLGHYVTVVFTENLGQVSVEITAVDDGLIVDYMTMTTPNGYQYYIVNTGTYIVTFTLENGDEYYGEFSVTD